MTTIVFKATVIKKDKGCFVARADDLSVTAEPASTQRGAIKKLKRTVFLRLRTAAETGTLLKLLDDAGYTGALSHLHDTSLQRRVYDSQTISVPLPHQLGTVHRAKAPKRATGNEKSSYV